MMRVQFVQAMSMDSTHTPLRHFKSLFCKRLR
jgi:hypothetical protein